ncbi:MAG: hypothetical protein QXQ64_07350 [Candidatus Bathyarchaeia archaeon]
MFRHLKPRGVLIEALLHECRGPLVLPLLIGVICRTVSIEEEKHVPTVA